MVSQILNDIAAALPAPLVLTKVEDGQTATLCVVNRDALPALQRELVKDIELWRSQTA
ncbi:hypothetical protein [Halovulum sp. GXIMD14793]